MELLSRYFPALVEINADAQPIMSVNGFSLPKPLENRNNFVILKKKICYVVKMY